MTPLRLPEDSAAFASLRAGDEVSFGGYFYGARDQAHARLAALLASGSELPVDLVGQTIYYVGPAPSPPGFPVGSCGPTTATRMDPFTPALLRSGLRGMIGKGRRSREVVDAIRETGSVYFYAFGGCGALYAERVTSCRIVAFDDLGPEAVYRFDVIGFPAIVAIDSTGRGLPQFLG
jgi:fumarate hydratase subunit beta